LDDILNAPLWQKILAVVLIVGIALWGYYNFLYKPKVTKLNSLKRELRTVEMELKLLMPPETTLKNGVDIRQIVRKELEELMKKIPTEKEVPYIIKDFITKVGRGLDIDYTLIKPGGVMPEGRYKKLPITVAFFADYPDLNLYLKELKKLPSTIRIDTLNLRRTSKAPELEIKMAMSAFVMPGGEPKKEDFRPERGQFLFDPFYKLEPAKKEAPKIEKKMGLELKGIWYGANVRAFINDKIVGVGEKIDGYTVTRITKDQVILREGDQVLTLKLEGAK